MAVLALVAHYLPTLPEGLILAALAGALGIPVDNATISLPEHQAAVQEAAQGATVAPLVNADIAAPVAVAPAAPVVPPAVADPAPVAVAPVAPAAEHTAQ
jgi:hypothetical protein